MAGRTPEEAVSVNSVASVRQAAQAFIGEGDHAATQSVLLFGIFELLVKIEKAQPKPMTFHSGDINVR